MMLPAWLALPLLIAAALGVGGVALRALRVEGIDCLEHGVIAFVLGMGILGWLIFFLGVGGMLTPPFLAALSAVCAAGLWTFRRSQDPPRFHFQSRRFAAFLVGVLALSAVFDIIAGLAPPADADSLAYHFTLPKLFLEQGRIFFTERAVDGAIPMLLHMTYAAALGLGGETCLTLWTMVTGWSAGVIVFVTARRLMSDEAALAIATLFLTSPAVLYGAGNGQVEVRNAAFVVLTFLAAMRAHPGNVRYTLLAGLAAGFFAASKYTGLVFVGSLGFVAIFAWRRVSLLATFALAVVVAGAQWYVWQWVQSGDPVFPMLAGFLPYRPGIAWTPEFHQYFVREFAQGETALSRDLFAFFTYPLLATFNPDPVFDSGRVGFGPLAFALLFFASAGVMARRRKSDAADTAIAFSIASVFYMLWFLLGPSQRVRHLLPVYPLLIMALASVSDHACACVLKLRFPLITAMVALLLVQLGAQTIFAANPGRYVFGLENRDEYLTRNIGVYRAIKEINARLTDRDRILLFAREGLYYLQKSFFLGHPLQEAEIDFRPSNMDHSRFLKQIDAHGVTHVLAAIDPKARSGASFLIEMAMRSGCLQELDQLAFAQTVSRTLDWPGVSSMATLLKRTEPSCSRQTTGDARRPDHVRHLR